MYFISYLKLKKRLAYSLTQFKLQIYNTKKMRQDNIPSTKQVNNKKQDPKFLTPVLYGQNIYINLTGNNQIQSLWGRGFMDRKVYLSTKREEIQSQFTIQPKKGLYSFQGKTTTPVVFGAQVLIKHVLSQEYIAIGEHDEMPILEFQKQESSSCYFQFRPLRTFQSNGNIITTDSIFLILNTERKLYITDLQNIQNLPSQPPGSPSMIGKKISRDEGLLNIQQPRNHHSGSAVVIKVEQEDKDQFPFDQITFKRKSLIKKTPVVEQFLRAKTEMSVAQNEQKRMSKIEMLPNLKISRTSSLQHQTQSTHPINIIQMQKIDSKKQLEVLPQINTMFNQLPIYNKQKNIKSCSVQNYPYSQWSIQHVKTQLKTEYLNNNDYIYFTHSLANQIMVLDIEKYPLEVSFVKNTNQSENEYILSSVFVAVIQKNGNKKTVYLKHFLTGKYFPLTRQGEDKVSCELIPLLSPKKNQYPPFKILFNGKPFIKEVKQKDKQKQKQKQNLHGFWLNKIPKTQIAEIMSLQNVDKQKAIEYLNNYLKTQTRRRQKILRQFFYIPRLISQLAIKHVTDQKQSNLKSYYQILFFICKNNEKNKKQCLKYIEQILKHPEKQLILDLLTELLIDNLNIYVVEKAITPYVIEDQMKEFVKEQEYSISFMRIFRVFCGSDEQPSIRNQCLLFNLFFWGAQVSEGLGMTESVAYTQRKLSLPNRYKFKVFEHEGSIYFSNGSEQQKYQNMREDIINYLRQYYYLLSDCMNGNNYQLIKNFTSVVSFDLLLNLLDKQNMKGPVLSLIYNAYLKPQKKYKPHIFHKDYEKICEKGSLLAYCGEEQEKLKRFVDKQIRQNKNYSSTMYRILLNVFKLTIENGYWRKFQDLIDLMNCLDGVILQPQTENTYHNTYEEKASDRNLLRSKITAISIKIVLIDMQVSLWASDYISGVYTEAQIQRRLIDQIKHTKNWVIDEKILKLCSTSSPQLLRKSILLLYKIYNLYKLAHKTYQQAQIQTKSKIELTNVFSILQIKQQIKIDNFFSIIAVCVKDISDIDELNPKALSVNYRNLQSLLKYKQVNQQVQNMTYKLGLHDMLIQDIKRYLSLAKKIKQQEQDIIYWKLLALYAIIRNNLKLRDIIAQHRKIFISFLQPQAPHYYVAIDIIQQIYRNNRKLIISDNEQLRNVCKSIDLVYRNAKMDLRFCKIINLLGVFIQTGNRKIVENHQIILQNVFTKNFVTSIIKVMKSSTLSRKQTALSQNKQQYFRHVLQIVIYDLLVTMGQKKLLSSFQRPSNQTIYALLLGIGTSNWSLKSKTFFCINFVGIKENIVTQFIRIILYDLNVMCQGLKVSDEQDVDISKQVKIYISNIAKILDTIQQLFKASLKKLSKQSEEQVLVIKIVERLFIMKWHCPQIVHKKIDNLLQFINIIESRLKIRSQYFELTKSLKKIQIRDFERNQIKDKLPLIYGEKIKNKVKVQRVNVLEQKNSLVEEVVKKKIKLNDMNKNTFEMTEDKIKELKTLILSLSSMNKTDSTLLSDNIKQFLINFLRVSFLEQKKQQQLVDMQDILVDYQVPTIVCSILEEPFKHRYKLFCSTFQLGIKLLEGGHSVCQQKFLDKFKQDGKNWIFQNIYQIIFDSLATIQFYYHYKQDPTIKSYQMILELQQYYTCKEQRKLSCELLANSFRFLQLLCQNNNHVMKQYVYNQLDKEDHIKYMTKNFIEIAQRILDGVFIVIQFNIRELRKMPNQRFQQEVRSNIFHLPIYILDFLIEVCQIPAEQNQLYLCRTDFLDFVKKLIDLRKTIKQKEKDKDWGIFFSFQRKLIILLKSLLEQNSEQISNLLRKKIGIEQFQFFIEESFIHGGLEDVEKLKQMLTQMQLNGYVQNIVDVLIVKKILKIQQKLHFQPQKLSILDQLNSRIQSIHVDFKTHSLTVYFPFHPLFSLLSKRTKDFMLDRTASLSTRRQKLTQLLIERQVIYQDINEEKNSEKRLLNQEKMGYLFNFSLFLCYLIISLLVLFYSVGKSGAVLDIFESKIISGLSYMQLLVCLIYTIVLGINARQKMKAHQLRPRGGQNEIHWIRIYFRMLKYVYIDEPQSTHASILFIISVWACFFEVRVYSFSLIFAFAKIQYLSSILKSIRLTWQQLVFVCLLALAFSFIFGFITLNYYIGPLYQNQQIDIDIDRINQHCNSIITCVSSLYTQKIIGQSVSRQDEEYNYGRFISDLIYWGFFQILLSNMIAAIIIDKFAEQRNAKQKIQHERYSKCYICFADKNTLERRGEDFMSHVNNVHNLWNYFFYLYTLENLKDITDFTGIQYWINRQVKQNQIDWIPIDDSFKDQDVSLHGLLEKLKPLLQEKEGEEK